MSDKNSFEQTQNELNWFTFVVSSVVSFNSKTHKIIENKGWCAIQGSNL
jgi:hypothetical protein